MQGISIGRRTGVGEVLGIQSKGKPAWLGFRSVALIVIPSWDRKLRAVSDWLIWPFVGRDIALMKQGGAPNFDAVTGERISARTVIVQTVRQEVLIGENDPGGYPRRYQHLVGSGEGRLYVDGRGYDVLWSRPDAQSVTSWTYAATGEPVVLPPGKVWWEIVPIGSAITER